MNIEQVKCIICEREYPRRVKIRGGRRNLGNPNERGKHTLTCSHKCSRIYIRVRSYIENRMRIRRDNCPYCSGKKMMKSKTCINCYRKGK